MERRLRTILDFLERQQARHLAKAKELPVWSYEKGFLVGEAQQIKLIVKWIREDVLEEVESAEAEVTQTNP